METLLAASGIDKIFRRPQGDLKVLDGCGIELAADGATAITGPSGAGKSTLLNILGALDRPDAGEILFRGEAITGWKNERLAAWRRHHVGFIFQFHFLLPDFTALENILLPVRIAGGDHREARPRAEWLLQRMELADRADHLPGQLSGGEQQRVAVARAFIGSPAIVMADEPFGNLDREKGERISRMLAELRAECGAALVLVTHDLTLAGRADRRLDLREGRLHVVDSDSERIEPQD